VRRAKNHERRGFTLIELMVALAAGALVALAAMILSRGAIKFFQSESRVSSAQLSAVLGLNRLTADLQRAGFLSSAHIQRDPSVCGNLVTFPIGLRQLSALTISKRGSVIAHGAELDQSVANGFNPDSIVIGGSFETTEQFPVRTIQPGQGGGLSVWLQTNSGPVQRSLANASQGAASLNDVFRSGRFLRIVDAGGKHEYGVISGLVVNGTPPTDIIVQLENAPMPQQRVAGGVCGWTGLGVGMLANPISRVRYDLRSLAAEVRFATLMAPQGGALSGDGKRTELVRVELDRNDAEIPQTLELVAEFAVDLKFGVVTTTGGPNPIIDGRFPITVPEDDRIYTVAGNITAGPNDCPPGTAVGGNICPQRLRGVQVRLSTRARAPDRDADLPAGGDGRRNRFFIATGAPKPVYARLRTLYADVSLPNLAGIQW
jgi:prepilin-type N-terminal cleavage/methylation domain-containing protein